MKRVINLAGSLLMVAGIALLVYVGVTYFRQQQHPAAKGWSTKQRETGQAIAQNLTKVQQINLPKSLQHAHLPPAGSESALRIIIPKISVDSPVVETAPVNNEWQVADWAVGHLVGSPEPGAAGNMALSAHDDIKGEIFKRVGELTPGDSIEVYTRHALYTYTVVNQLTVDPSDVSVLNPWTKAPALTLISCSPYWVDTQRLVVQAVLKSRAAA